MASEIKVDDIKDVAGAFTQARFVDESHIVDGEVNTGTIVIPRDDTIPQNDEGDQYMSLAHTPKSATNILRIDIVVHIAHTAVGDITVALFQDAIVDAVAAISQAAVANRAEAIHFTYYMVAGTTSEITFNIRAGSISAGTSTFNGISSVRLFGGVAASSMSITEIKSD